MFEAVGDGPEAMFKKVGGCGIVGGMINSIHGVITEKSNTTLRILGGGGIEWDITVPATDLNALPQVGENARVFTFVHHTDAEARLYGFAEERRRAAFLAMLKVEGLGPRGVVKIMGNIGQDELETALEDGDLARLEAVPGLGKKTAQKMLLALKGKLSRGSGKEGGAAGGVYADLVEALAGMGYERRSAAQAVARADGALEKAVTGAEREKLLFKQAIVYLSTTPHGA
ncbi:MAG: Holliday junction branch migration protein RuvA [Spirochaetaceae bacterium]|jgi:Holliday junction DNA helicase RuvA|nr:Holliday junction branch migration protein RuvA [Spirochaetaceae bacterium]